MTDTAPRPPDPSRAGISAAPTSPLEALAQQFDGGPEIEDRLGWELVVSMEAFGLEFRKRIGRPMTAEEWALAWLAHSFGFTDGVEIGFDVAEESMEREAGPEGEGGG